MASAAPYSPARPDATLLRRVLTDHLATTLAEARADGGTAIPYFVERELREAATCGTLARGFLRVRCDGCRAEQLLAFRCKSRAACPSCAARRMADCAARLVDNVLPVAPYRQWVLSPPRPVRLAMALHPEVSAAILTAFLRAVFAWQRRRAKRIGHPKARTAAITFVQRFSSALRLHPHFHSLLPDGVFVDRGAEALSFVELTPPSDVEVGAILKSAVTRIRRVLARLEAPDLDDGQQSLSALYRDAIKPEPAAPSQAPSIIGRRTATYCGWSLHANTAVHRNDRDQLERLCRYGLRPPFAMERMAASDDGRVLYKMKRPLPDGTSTLSMHPADFLRRIASLVPPPRVHLTRYHGAFAPNARDRARVVRVPHLVGKNPSRCRHAAKEPTPIQLLVASHPVADPYRIPWDQLLKRSFASEVFHCDCGGTRRVLAAITQPHAIERILGHLGLPTKVPEFAPARPRPWRRAGPARAGPRSVASPDAFDGVDAPSLFD